MENAAVFPVPVCAQPRMSRPCKAYGIACSWIGVGSTYPCSLTAFKIGSVICNVWNFRFSSFYQAWKSDTYCSSLSIALALNLSNPIITHFVAEQKIFLKFHKDSHRNMCFLYLCFTKRACVFIFFCTVIGANIFYRFSILIQRSPCSQQQCRVLSRPVIHCW